MVGDPLDVELRRFALDHVLELSRRYDGLVHVDVLREGFPTPIGRLSYGSFYAGIHRPKEFAGRAALSLTTTPPTDEDAPYDDGYDEETQTFTYHYRRPKSDTERARIAAARDNGAMRAAFEIAVPLIYFNGIVPSQYTPIAPIYLTHDDPIKERVEFQVAWPTAEIKPDFDFDEPARRYATRQAHYRLHQQRFRENVLRAYSRQCAVCRLREVPLLQAAHIIGDTESRGTATVANGIALCAIHHLAYDRNLLGIAPDGVVHIATRLLHEIDGPMLKVGLQGFHGSPIQIPRRPRDRPDPELLEIRFGRFRDAA
ncbi:HNH endonuclease [Solirubrobacter sp. CPCC 204708]|uniref:HNH endonuclease n=1 Tax=Solirubrobacter deserti TaxID=2282478 RepID=A0ABT4RCU7_9ACTN|nr:HNH endonuclease [Solirubrobacter deserti]